jgi:hypothetical protein
MRTISLIAVTVMVLGLATGCGSKSQALQGGQLKQTIEIEAQKDFIEAMGIGAADPNMATATQRKATSRNAAIVDAQYQLVAKIKGVQIEGGITIQKAMETDSKISATVDNMVKGAEITKMEWTNDDGCVVTMRVNKKDIAKETGLKLQ